MDKRKKEITGVYGSHWYGCYRCGAINGETEVEDYSKGDIGVLTIRCGECGEENSIVTFTVALDMLNEAHFHDRMRGGINYEKSVDDVDEFLAALEKEKE